LKKAGRSLGALLSRIEIARALQRLYLTPKGGVLAALCGLLFLWLSYEVLASPPTLQPSAIALPKRASAALTVRPFVPPSLDMFAVIDDKLVFNPLRQPIRSATAAVEQTGQPPAFVLVGVILSSGERIAITKSPGSNASVNVRVGENLEGWEVTTIEADHIELRSGADVMQLPLHPASGPAPIVRPQDLGPLQEPAPAPEPEPSPNP